MVHIDWLLAILYKSGVREELELRSGVNCASENVAGSADPCMPL